jgi:hypothetical protein
VPLLLALLVRTKIRLSAFSALGIVLLLFQTFGFLAVSGGCVLAAGGSTGCITNSAGKHRPEAAAGDCCRSLIWEQGT